jgi:hypothetical protein
MRQFDVKGLLTPIPSSITYEHKGCLIHPFRKGNGRVRGFWRFSWDCKQDCLLSSSTSSFPPDSCHEHTSQYDQSEDVGRVGPRTALACRFVINRNNDQPITSVTEGKERGRATYVEPLASAARG